MPIIACQPKRPSAKKFIPGFLSEIAGGVAEFLVEHGYEIEPRKTYDPDWPSRNHSFDPDEFFAHSDQASFTIHIDYTDCTIVAGCHNNGVGHTVLFHDPGSFDDLLEYMQAQCGGWGPSLPAELEEYL